MHTSPVLKLTIAVCVPLFVEALLPLAAYAQSNWRTVRTIQGQARVIDGDTIVVGRMHVRLNGVAAPERNEIGGRKATVWMRRFLAGHVIRCELIGERTYNRWVGICYRGSRDIGAAIIRAGFARDCPRYSGGRYRQAELAARARGKDVSRQYHLPQYCS